MLKLVTQADSGLRCRDAGFGVGLRCGLVDAEFVGGFTFCSKGPLDGSNPDACL